VNLKKFIIHILFLISSRIRPFILIKFLKKFKHLKFINRIILYYDPNTVRKYIPFIFKENLVDVNIHKGRYRININDHIGYLFYLNDGFDNMLLKIGEKINFKNDDILIDIGANIGTASIPFALRYDNGVIAFEASKNNSSLLHRNMFINGIRASIHCFCAVDKLNTRSRWIEMYHQSGNSGANSIHQDWNPSIEKSSIEHVKTNTIDNVLSDEDFKNTRLIKIDVEGSEFKVLSGASKLLDNEIPIVFEYRPDLDGSNQGHESNNLLDLLNEKFSIFNLLEKVGDIVLTGFDRQHSYHNLIALPNNKIEYYKKLLQN